MNRSPLRAFLLIPFVLACFALSPQARAVCQEGCDTVNANTFLGDDALLDHFGVSNTAVGWHALTNNTGGAWNTAIGSGALESNISGYDNTATGVGALSSNTTACCNTATGSGALEFNTTGFDNTATGASALSSNRTGSLNVANVWGALGGNISGRQNTAVGYFALYSNTTGNRNTASGYGALNSNTTGKYNIALGFNAGANLTTGSANIDIGNQGFAGESTTIRIGDGAVQTATYIAGISGATVPTGVAVIVDTDGHLGTIVSSARFKDEIKPMDKASEAILDLQPVTFRYKHEFDPKGIAQFGLVAEDVEKVNPDLVARDEEGKAYTVRYEAVNAMLLNEFIKEHRTVQEQKATIAELKHNFAEQQKQIEVLTAGLQKVSRQAEMSRPASQMVLNNQ